MDWSRVDRSAKEDGAYLETCCADILRGQPQGTCHAPGTARKLVHMKSLVHFYVGAGTVCQSSVQDATLKMEVICPS